MAKHYYILLDNSSGKIVTRKNCKMRRRFWLYVYIWLLKDSGFKNIQPQKGYIHVFCGKQKLNVITNEACLLGLEDALFISNERRK